VLVHVLQGDLMADECRLGKAATVARTLHPAKYLHEGAFIF